MRKTKLDKRTNLEKEIDAVLELMSVMKTDSKEYAATVECLDKLYKIKSEEKKGKISPDTVAVVAGNLLGIVLILSYEKANVITSKALSFIIKGRV